MLFMLLVYRCFSVGMQLYFRIIHHVSREKNPKELSKTITDWLKFYLSMKSCIILHGKSQLKFAQTVNIVILIIEMKLLIISVVNMTFRLKK